MDNKIFLSRKFQFCLDDVFIYFLSDTIYLLDHILSDVAEPESSVICVYQRLKNCMCFENISLDKNYKSLSEYLDFCGYSKEDIELFFQKLKKEKNVSS